MKKYLIAAFAAMAIILTALPFSMGFAVEECLTDKYIKSHLPKQFLRMLENAWIKTAPKSYERSAFSAKSVVMVYGAGLEILIVDTDFSFGWYVAGRFPYIYLVKARLNVRLSDKLLETGENVPDSLREEGLGSGDAYFTPKVGGSGVFTTTALAFGKESSVDISPIVLSFERDVAENSLSAAVDWKFLRVKSPEFALNMENVRVSIDGNILDFNADSEFALSIQNFAAGDPNKEDKIENIIFKNVQRNSGDFINIFNELSVGAFDIISTKRHLAGNKLFLSIEAENLDRGSLIKYVDNGSPFSNRQKQSKRGRRQIYDLGVKMLQNAVFNGKLSMFFDGKPLDITAIARLDTTSEPTDVEMFFVSDGTLGALFRRFIVDVDISADERIEAIFDAPVSTEKERYFEFRREDHILEAAVRIERGEIIMINGKNPQEFKKEISP